MAKNEKNNILATDEGKMLWAQNGSEIIKASANVVKDLNAPYFPNGFDNWQETHFVVVENILHALSLENGNFAENEYNERGQGGMWVMARTLTDWFELKFKGEIWGDNRDWYDEIEKMFASLYEEKTFAEWCAKNGVDYGK